MARNDDISEDIRRLNQAWREAFRPEEVAFEHEFLRNVRLMGHGITSYVPIHPAPQIEVTEAPARTRRASSRKRRRR